MEGEEVDVPVVESCIVVKSAIQTVYDIVKDFESLASYLPNVDNIKITERGEGYVLTEWEVSVIGRQLQWLERDEFDDENYRIRYKQIEGKLAKFEGEWRFEGVDNGVQISLLVDFDLGKPTLAALFTPVLVKAIEDNSNKMLHAIKERAEREGG